MTARQFMAYRAIILGDASCQSGEAALQAAIETRRTWGSVVDGDIVILSTNPTSSHQHGVLYNFVDATSITAQGFGFWGTVLAPHAHVNFSNGSWDGGIYAKSLTGNAEGHTNPLNDRDICE